jgi:hypothetical protein
MTRRRSSLAKKRAAEAARSEATAAADNIEATCIDANEGGKGLIAKASGAPDEPSPAATTSSQLTAVSADASSTSAQPALCCAAPLTSAADEETSASSGVAAALQAATMGDIPASFMNRQASQTRANGNSAAMSKQKLHRTSLVEKMTASAIALRKASIASKAFHHEAADHPSYHRSCC